MSKVIFARHETFHPRFGWLKKGFDRALEWSHKEKTVFLQDDATVHLGVGKNMVRSIRYWCHAFKLLEGDEPTEFAKQLLGETGWDTYLEDTASLWLLHWKLLQDPCDATAWKFVFNDFRLIEFTQQDLLKQLQEIAPNTADSSLRKDISCLLRMYVEQSGRSSKGEDALDCPFTELGLIDYAGDSRHYTFRIGHKATLPAALMVYACLDYVRAKELSARTIPIANLLYDSRSPGLIFKLTERVLCNGIETVGRQFKEVQVTDAAGKLQFVFDKDPEKLAEEILNHYYNGR